MKLFLKTSLIICGIFMLNACDLLSGGEKNQVTTTSTIDSVPSKEAEKNKSDDSLAPAIEVRKDTGIIVK